MGGSGRPPCPSRSARPGGPEARLDGPRAPDLSVVLPVYNEEESLAPLCAELREVLDAIGLDYEIVFVDDGSADRSAEVLRGLRETTPRIRLIRLKANVGETAAL